MSIIQAEPDIVQHPGTTSHYTQSNKLLGGIVSHWCLLKNGSSRMIILPERVALTGEAVPACGNFNAGMIAIMIRKAETRETIL